MTDFKDGSHARWLALLKREYKKEREGEIFRGQCLNCNKRFKTLKGLEGHDCIK